MKTIIRNTYIDFSTVTHIEDNINHIILHVFCGDSINIHKQETPIEQLEGVSVVQLTSASEFEKYRNDRDIVWEVINAKSGHMRVAPKKSLEKDEEIWQKEKAQIIDIWNKTESAIKDIKIIK